ncbi:ankyrin repeat domain-containing protein 40 isoform X2 [Chrysemys picta bellii]|uniref:ankyrin repeat domain-containing protein 40 isoform X2 n=1 Tax=Chrysemys picta bellii TaxID=8478 RepID=UPI001C66B506|nr:ankyrin repeat domain-containing protein 40 isoform X2 [Chrysemys picta bellii]
MTTFVEEKELQERLREAAALGDIGEVQRLVEFGVNVNSQNEINGWTCLHWACKRNHAQVVSYLIESGADKEILTSKGETPAQLTSKREIRKTLGVADNEDMLTSPGACTMPECPKPVVQNGPIHQASVPQSRSFPSPAASKQPVSQQQNGSCLGPMPTFQPFFFPGAFPFNMQELVLKVRIQNLSLRENDFIEIELDRQELTYKELLRVSCSELGVNPEHVEKIRKLPNTVLRKDKDVARLQDFQELELVLIINDNNFLFRNAASTLTERPCYNKKASKLTY